MNPMRTIRIEKLTLNIGAGKEQDRLEKARVLLKTITGLEPIKTITNKRITAWGLRPGLPIGVKLTLRKKKAQDMLKRLLDARDFKLRDSQIDKNGNIAFGIHEYIDIPGVKYDPKIGIMGLEVCVTLERPGFRIKRRAIKQAKIAKKHAITKEEAIEFVKKEFNVIIGE
jgi:large subunit ribosomal protein L5